MKEKITIRNTELQWRLKKYYRTRTTPNPLDVLELKEETEGGFNLVGFVYNNDEHYYHYIFVKYEQGEEAANTDSKQSETAAKQINLNK